MNPDEFPPEPVFPDFTPGPQHERPIDDLEYWCCSNWENVHHLTRQACVNHLREVVPLEMITKWKEQYKRGISPGSDNPLFHMGEGMFLRNELRSILTDEYLPLVPTYPGGAPYGARNWDDYYIGALFDLVA